MGVKGLNHVLSCLDLSMAGGIGKLEQFDETKALAVGARGSADASGRYHDMGVGVQAGRWE